MHHSQIKQILFPEPPRECTAERAIRIALRTAHIAAVGILLGGHVFSVERAQLLVWRELAVGTGTAFVAVELYGSFVWVTEVRGWLTLLKILLLCFVPLFWEQRVWLLLAVLVIGSVGSHMPSRFRYYSPFHGEVEGEERRG